MLVDDTRVSFHSFLNNFRSSVICDVNKDVAFDICIRRSKTFHMNTIDKLAGNAWSIARRYLRAVTTHRASNEPAFRLFSRKIFMQLF